MKTFLALLSLLPFVLHAQETESAHQPKLRGAIMMANSHIPAAENSNNAIDVLPSWGIDLDYFFHRRWSVAFISDIKLFKATFTIWRQQCKEEFRGMLVYLPMHWMWLK
jgi:hypothetical protein